MQNHKKVKDMMVDIFDFPHIPYWFTIKQAIQIIKNLLPKSEKSFHPMGMLVFDEHYNLLGTLAIKDILKGLEPKFMKSSVLAPFPKEEEEPELSLIWDTLFDRESRDLSEHPVSEFMVPAQFFVELDDPVTKAAYMMIRHDLIFLPVLEGKKKFVGVIRMLDVFDELSNAALNTISKE